MREKRDNKKQPKTVQFHSRDEEKPNPFHPHELLRTKYILN